MKFSIARQNMDRAIQRVLGVVSPKTTLPVLANLLVESDSEGKGISMTATDLDMTVTTRGEASVESGGGVTVPAKRLAEIVRELPEGDIGFASEGEEIAIRSGRSNFKIVGIPTEEFPTLPKSDPKSAFSVDGEAIVRMVDKVGFCTSRDETRPSLNGAYWEFDSGATIMTATDGHRLATFRLEGDFGSAAGKSMIVPPKALAHAVRVIGAEGEDTIKISVHENHVAFFVGSTVINSRLLEGPFPNYRQVIPKDNDKELVVDRETFMGAVRRVSVLADTLTHQVRLAISKKKVGLVVSTPDVGEAREEIEGSFTGESMEIGYNANYLLDVLKHMDGDDVRLLLSTPVGAAIVRSADAIEGEEYTCLLMPLRLTS